MENHTDTTPESPTIRPFGYWLRAVDGLIAREFAAAFDAEGVTRRDWRILSLLSGDVVAPELTARLERHGGKKLRGLIERGWVAQNDGTWTLTDEGRAAHARLGDVVGGIRATVAGAVTDEDFATTLASLEKIARELGWNPDERMPRAFGRPGFGPARRGHGHGFGHGFGRRGQFGPGFGPQFGPGFGPQVGPVFGAGHPGFGPGHGHGFAPGRGPAIAPEHGYGPAYERGFDAGFSRGAASRDA